MISLEKKMFFLPNKYFIRGNTLFIAFNLSAIPRDMSVVSMALHVQLPRLQTSTIVTAREIVSAWNIRSMKKGATPLRFKKIFVQTKHAANRPEWTVNVTPFHRKWRSPSKGNHGLHITFKNRNLTYLVKHPPYLVLDTI